MDRQQELQQDILWLQEKLEPIGEPKLPLVLSGEILKQRAQTAPKHHFSPWRKMVPLACSIVLVAVVGFWSGFAMTKTAETADSANYAAEMQMAAYSVEEAAAAPAAFSLEAEDDMAYVGKAIEVSMQVTTHSAVDMPEYDMYAWETIEELYPGVTKEDLYILVEDGELYTVLQWNVGTPAKTIVVQAGETEVYSEADFDVVRDITTGKELRFDSLTLELIK